jgi:hypothetical protein
MTNTKNSNKKNKMIKKPTELQKQLENIERRFKFKNKKK